MAIKLDYTNMMAAVIGAERGIRDEELDGLRPRAEEIHRRLMADRKEGALPFYDLPFDERQVEEIMPMAEHLAERFDNIVVLGIGGSALGTSALLRALCPLYHNLADRNSRQSKPRLFILDNVDPVGFAEALAMLDPQTTVFLVISKSGSTVETMCQFLIAQQWIRRSVAGPYQEHFVLITDPTSGSLRSLAESEGFRAMAIPEKVGGRFTAFTPVSLLPLAAVGVDIRALLQGAADMSGRVCQGDLLGNPAYLNAALQYLAYQKGMPISVTMPYSDRLRDIADWFRQLWAESLGKKNTLDGRTVHVGPTPVNALGTTDQHSQVQLYMEGPFDKVVTFIVPEAYGSDLTIPGYPPASSLSYLEGQSLSKLIRSEYQATVVALTKNSRPNCTISLPEVSAEWLGSLLYFLEVQTVFAGGLFNVNPLDQPGVEQGKDYTYALMGRPGYEAVGAEFDHWFHRAGRRIL